MHWLGVKCSIGALILTLTMTTAQAAPFKDPLQTPALLSVKAQSSRLTAVTRAGNRLVVVGRMGHILISDDEGKTWKQIPVPISCDLVAVRFVTPDKGWAVGHDGVVLHSADGGSTWVKQLDGFLAAKAIQTAYEKRAAAGDPDAEKLRAEAQQLVEAGADKPFFDVLFRNEKEGFVVGAFNLALRTRDGGKSWEPLGDRTDNPQAAHLYALAVAEGQLYLAGEMGLLRRWSDQSERFEKLESPYKGSFFGLLAKSKMLIAYGMRGSAFRSDDGGKSWKTLQTGTTGGITSGAVLPDGRIVLATQSGGVLMSGNDGDTFVPVKVDRPAPWFGVAAAGRSSVALAGMPGVRTETIEYDKR